ncbi:hypothetical protein ACFV4K_18755 [Nocardia sp. NPDC059764]|uniref:hypothetical protein n=1 Tax=Nocardia sp. NPDC059764 TaxID=3346939 RepID=UPI003669E0FB
MTGTVTKGATASNGLYVAIVIITIYWAAVFVSSRGAKTVAGLSSMELIIGTLIPGALLVLLGFVFLGQGNPSAAPMDTGHLFPVWTGLASLVLIVNVGDLKTGDTVDSDDHH